MAHIIYMYHKNGGLLQPKAETTRLNMIERGKSRYTPSIPRYISIYKRNLFLDFNLNRSSAKKMAHFKWLWWRFSHVTILPLRHLFGALSSKRFYRCYENGIFKMCLHVTFLFRSNRWMFYSDVLLIMFVFNKLVWTGSIQLRSCRRPVVVLLSS